MSKSAQEEARKLLEGICHHPHTCPTAPGCTRECRYYDLHWALIAEGGWEFEGQNAIDRDNTDQEESYMLKETVSIDDVLEVLNRIVKADPQAAHDLVETRVECNQALAKDPTIQVVAREIPLLGKTGKLISVGLLGVLNGIFGAHDDGWGAIQVMMEKDGTVVEFGLTKQAKEAFGR